eukprot:SM000051S17562  [mRNA]  locus=s51:359140:360512:- [translate_table: standard]
MRTTNEITALPGGPLAKRQTITADSLPNGSLRILTPPSHEKVEVEVAGPPAATPAAHAEIRRKRATAERQLGAPPAARREQVRAAVVDEKRSKATAPTPTACDWLTERRRPGQGGRARSGAAAGGGTRTRKRKATASQLRVAVTRLHRVRRGHSGHAAKQARYEDFAGGWTGIQLHRRFLNSSKEHCRSPRRLDRPSVAPPIPEFKQRALPLSQVLLHALCRLFASFAGVPSHARQSVAEPTCGWMDFAGGWTGLQLQIHKRRRCRRHHGSLCRTLRDDGRRQRRRNAFLGRGLRR